MRTHKNQKAKEVTSKRVLAWTRRVKAQRAQKAITGATNEIKDSDIYLCRFLILLY